MENHWIQTAKAVQTMPLSPNDSGINKAKNRRVEFVKI